MHRLPLAVMLHGESSKRRGTQRARITYNQPNRPNRQTSQTKHQSLPKGQPSPCNTPLQACDDHSSRTITCCVPHTSSHHLSPVAITVHLFTSGGNAQAQAGEVLRRKLQIPVPGIANEHRRQGTSTINSNRRRRGAEQRRDQNAVIPTVQLRSPVNDDSSLSTLRRLFPGYTSKHG